MECEMICTGQWRDNNTESKCEPAGLSQSAEPDRSWSAATESADSSLSKVATPAVEPLCTHQYT